jgi:hypothetical protein
VEAADGVRPPLGDGGREFARQDRVRDPSPGPTSRTVSSGWMSAAATILRMVLPSMTKFCPRDLVGRIPISSASLRMSEAPIRGAGAVAGAGAGVLPGAEGVGSVT